MHCVIVRGIQHCREDSFPHQLKGVPMKFSALFTIILTLSPLGAHAVPNAVTCPQARCQCEQSTNRYFYIYLYDHTGKKQGNFQQNYGDFADCLRELVRGQQEGYCPR